MQKLINSVQNYAWGSKTALTELYGIANPQQQPQAELWMGAHPKKQLANHHRQRRNRLPA
ncbi:mannose-6-phosphate isomerase [Salmonella enterica subsp. arizonae]|nr:mannose-6-phosphate isomerase [Salmonella enterica subsp. arizonae]